jgi:hypothetical protein
LLFLEKLNGDAVTSVIAWIAADKRRATGLYFASDSRRSWEGQSETRDDCIKLFVAEGTREIFAFAGDATFPPKVLDKICFRLKSQPDLVNAIDDSYERSAWVYSQIKAEFDVLVTKPKCGFAILHGTRVGAMFAASFHLFEYSYDRTTEALAYGVLNSEAGNSVMLGTLGTGHAIVKSFVKNETTQLGDVSRAQFSAFCAAVASNQDDWSGGPIQLVGILSIKDALHFGVITPNGTFYRGSTQLPSNHSMLRWRNSEFEDVDAQGNPRLPIRSV